MAVSPDGTKLASASQNNGLEVLNINRFTGQISFSSILSNTIRPYGLTFSPNGNLIYCTDIQSGQITQWNLANNSSQIIGTVPVNNSTEPSGAIQLGPDGIIYVCEPYSSFLGTISNPNITGVGCNYIPSTINLGTGQCRMGLPPFVNSIISPQPHNIVHLNNCLNDFIYFTIGDTNTTGTYNWNFGEPNAINNTSIELNPKHKYANTGNYTITLIRTLDCLTDTFSTQIAISDNPHKSQNTTICQGGSFTRPNGISTSLAGTYIDTIPNQQGCDSIITSVLTLTPSGVTITIDAIKHVTCFGGNDGQISISASNGVAPYSYTWNNGLSSSSENNLPSGNYFIIAKDARQCSDTISFEIQNAQLYTIAISPDQTICPDESVEISANVIEGGTAPFTITWNNNSTQWNQSVNPQSTSTFIATVTDSKGCVASENVTISISNTPIADFTTSPQGTVYVDQVVVIKDNSLNANSKKD